MDWFHRLCSILPAPDCIVHIGAGSGSDLAAYESLPNTRVVLIEPQPRLAAGLRQTLASNPGIEVLECAVEEAAGPAQLHVFNVPSLSSLKQPTGLRALMPGLVQTAQLEVEVRTLDEITDSLGLDRNGEHWLVIDAPGAEPVLVDVVAASAEPPVFRQIFLSGGVESLYEGGRPMAQMQELLDAGGYSSLIAMDDADPDWPRAHLFFDEEKVRNRELDIRLDALKVRSTELAKSESQKERLLEQQRKEFEDKLSGLGEELRNAAEVAEHKINEMTATLSGKEDELASQAKFAEEAEAKFRSEIEKAHADLSAQARSAEEAEAKFRSEIEKAHADLSAQARSAEEAEAKFRSEIEKAHADLSAQARSAEEAEAKFRSEIEKARAEQSAQARSAEEAQGKIQSELEKARADLAVSVRVQALREADLRDLQERFAKVTEVKDRQHELLVKLGQRLGAATEYLKQLKSPDGKADSYTAAEGLVRVLAGEVESNNS